MAQNNRLPSGSEVVIMVTGHGLKDIDGVMQAVSRTPVVVGNDIGEVERKLGNV